MRVFDADLAHLDAADAPRAVAEQEDVAAHALHREVFVHLADEDAGRLLDDVVVGGIRNRAAAGDRGEPGAAARTQLVVHAVAVQMRRAPAAAGGDAFAEHLQHRLEVVALEVAERVGAMHQLPHLVLRSGLRPASFLWPAPVGR